MPQTVYDVGDPITSRLNIGVDKDGTTVTGIDVYRPDGTAIADPTITPVVGSNREFTAKWYGTNDGTAGAAVDAADGDWVAVWKVTGTGEGTQAKVYNVRELPTASNTRPTWAPALADVADYIPTRTLDTSTPGSTTQLGTFTGATTPTDEQVQRLVDGAVASVQAVVGTFVATSAPLARTVAALRAAAAIERAYPDRDAQVNTAEELDARADAELRRLVASSKAAKRGGVRSVVLVCDTSSYPYRAADD
jgi:hypothetical protein